MGENPVKGKLFKIVHVAYPSSFYEKEPGDFDQSYDFAVFTTEKDFPNEMLPVQLSLTKEIKSGINVNAAGYGYSDLEEKNHTYPAYGKLRAIRKAKTNVTND